jgi:uncharacterized protein (TIGR03437 family)
MRFLIPLVILASTTYSADFTTYIGPSSEPNYSYPYTSALATDLAGDTYVTGGVWESNAFVTKLDIGGNIVFTNALGPAGTYSYGNAIAVDLSGNVWVGGETVATNFPVMNALQPSKNIGGTGFLVKMAPDGTVLYSSFIGGMLGESAVNGIATDRSGNVYVTGWTDASDFPSTPGLPASPVTGSILGPVYGLFAAKLDPTGQKILYSTVIAGAECAFCFGNAPKTVGAGIAVDGSGNALVAGGTNATALPVTATGSGPGPFVFEINAAGRGLVYFSYLAASIAFGSTPIAADASGNAYIAGYTGVVGFATKLSPAGTTVWTKPLGGPNPNVVNAISLDSSDNVWLTGNNGSSLLPGGDFVAELSADGSKFLYSEQFPTGEAGQAIAIDQSGVVHFAGSSGLISTLTPTQPLAPRALSIVNAASGQLSGTVAPREIVSIYGLGLGPANGVTAAPENGLFPTSLGGVQVSVNGGPMPLLYVSASQINAEIPTGVASGGLVPPGTADIQVVYNSSTLPDFRLAVVGSNFAPFENEGSMAVINQDGTLNKIANPAKPGTVVSIWATGFGLSGPLVDGAVATAANNYCSSCQVTLFNGTTSITETVEYAGTSPGLIDGVMQISFMIPAQLNYEASGAWLYFMPPGDTQLIQLGWVNISQ